MNTVTIHQLLSTKAHVGNKATQWNPKIKGYLFGKRYGINFFDLKMTLPSIRKVLFFITKAATNHQIILFVGTHPFVTFLVKFLATSTQQSSLSTKWVSGTLTNWLRIRPYVKFLFRTDINQIKKQFSLRTEKKIEQKIIQYLKMKHLLMGIERMSALPNLVVFISPPLEAALNETSKLMIPTISIVNTNSLLKVNYPLFGNDYIFDSVFFFGNLILNALYCGLLERRLRFITTTKG